MKKLCIFLVFLFVISTASAPPPPDKDYTNISVNGVACGPHGDAKTTGPEYQSNTFKNRYDFPKNNDFDRSIDLAAIEKAKADQNNFSPQKAVEIEGYVYDVKVGGKETCNCHAADPLLKDTHIELVVNPDKSGEEKRVIVEVTPRIRQIMEEQGFDWTTETLQNTIKHQWVKIQGWLFYDISHDKENFADDPEDNIGRPNWRATSWEVHPVTSIEVVGDDLPATSNNVMSTSSDNEGDGGYDPNSGKPLIKSMTSNPSNNNNMNTHQSAGDMLVLIALGAILGMVGQGLRTMVGLKKLQDLADVSGQSKDQLYQVSRVVMSFVIACAIGAIAGVVAALSKLGTDIDKSVLFSFVAAGYAGTDFIEGFLRKEGTAITGGKPPAITVTPTPKEGNSPV